MLYLKQSSLHRLAREVAMDKLELETTMDKLDISFMVVRHYWFITIKKLDISWLRRTSTKNEQEFGPCNLAVNGQ